MAERDRPPNETKRMPKPVLRSNMDRVVFTSPALRIVCISDTHNDDCQEHIPQGDILIHAGDLTDDGTFEELRSAFEWISTLTHKVKVIIAGTLRWTANHKSFSAPRG